MNIGLHTLTAVTTPNDSYVSPIPDDNLAKLWFSAITANISENADAIPLESGEAFRVSASLRTVQLGSELITYEKEENGVLRGLVRGAWGTGAAAHKAGEKAQLLCDHSYRVFSPEL